MVGQFCWVSKKSQNHITSILLGFGGASYMAQWGTIRIKIFALISKQENDTKTLRKIESKCKKDLLAQRSVLILFVMLFHFISNRQQQK